jgi:hypothetical protein
MAKGHHSHHHGKHRASGGRAHEVVSGNPDVLKEAKGEEPYDKGDERKHGGKVKRAKGGHVMHMDGKKSKHRMDRPGRKRGGAVGADRSPLSSAHRSHGGGGESPSSKDTYGGTPA